jgi:hypothetical protein
MTKGEREFMILDGGYHQFDYLVLDEVHTRELYDKFLCVSGVPFC